MEGVLVPSGPSNKQQQRGKAVMRCPGAAVGEDFMLGRRRTTRGCQLNRRKGHKRNGPRGREWRRGGRDTNGNAECCLNGKYTREVYHAIFGRLGHAQRVPGDCVRAVFNDMHLYPSKSEVSEMLHCARQVGRRNGSYLTFGEFCVFSREMQKPRPERKHQQSHNLPNKCTNNCEVFLGGSCNPTTWRADTAIPELQKHGISYYNPQVAIWAPELVAKEHDAKQSASLLLYVIDSQTRSVAGMIEVGYLVAAGRCVVLVVCPYREGQSIMDEPITQREYLDLANGQTSLLALVKSQGIKVHANLSSALQCTAGILRNASVNNGMTAEQQVTHKLRVLRESFDSFDTSSCGEIRLLDVVNAYRQLTHGDIDLRSLCGYLRIGESDVPTARITFDQFCALVAEFSSCTSTPDDWITHPLSRNNNNTQPPQNCKTNTSFTDVYLGGSCSSQICWREGVALPLLKTHGLTYYNPAVRECDDQSATSDCFCESNVLRWKRAMDRSRVLLFYVTGDTRSLTTMVLAAYYIGLNRNVVLCINHLPHDDVVIAGEKLTKQAIKDYNRGRVYLHDLAKRKQVPVFEDITEAVQTAADRSRRCR